VSEAALDKIRAALDHVAERGGVLELLAFSGGSF
jgi:hypothetical protein